MAIERTTSIAKIEVISRGGHLACKVLRVVESLILVSVLNRFLVHELVSRLYPRQEHKQRNHNQSREMHKQHDAKHVWYARYDMRCICVLRKENDEHGSNLANQACHWKDEMISVEIDIKITGIGCTVCKWQAKQEWHESAINSKIALKMQQVTMLQHPNIATKHMAVIYRRCLTKDEHWATASSQHIKLKQAWQKCKRLQVHRLSEKLDMAEISIR